MGGGGGATAPQPHLNDASESMVEEGIASSCLRELDVGRFKFANRVCKEWNGLDDDVVAVDPHLRNVRGYFQALAFFQC